MRTFAIGDIHGCNTALLALLDAIQPQAADVLVFLGDYIDRGPSSREVIETLLKLSGQCKPVFLRGNHEVMVLEARDDFQKSDLWQSYGGLETIYSYNGRYQADWSSSIPDFHWKFFEQTRRFYETQTEYLCMRVWMRSLICQNNQIGSYSGNISIRSNRTNLVKRLFVVTHRNNPVKSTIETTQFASTLVRCMEAG